MQVALGEVNTSVGVKPTTTANKWKLQTDPSEDSTSVTDFSTYIVSSGALSNSYDPTKFQLDVDPNTLTYALGATVEGLGAYEVTSFEVLMKNGGFITVAANPTPGGPDILTPSGPNATGGEAGEVLDVHYQLIPDRKADALPANMDQFFYEINLVQIGNNPNFDPGVVTTFGDAGVAFFTVVPTNPTSPNPPITTLFNATSGPGGGPNFQTTSNVPEPTSLGLLGIAAISLLGRRRKVSPAPTR